MSGFLRPPHHHQTNHMSTHPNISSTHSNHLSIFSTNNMSNIASSCLSPTSRETVEQFARRSDYWLQLPGDQRRKVWQFDSPGEEYSHTAHDVVRFTEANCPAVTAASDDKLLNEFKEKLATEWDRSQITPYEGMDLAELISEYVVWVDYLFFFGILTRTTVVEDELRIGQPLYKLLFEEGLHDATGNEMEGVFNPETAEMRINLTQSSGEFQSLDKALAVIVHEMTHMYLDVLTSDDSFASYYRDLFQNRGHGVQFHELLQFNLTQLFNLVPTMSYLGDLAAKTQEDLHFTLAQPDVSEADARKLIGCCHHHD